MSELSPNIRRFATIIDLNRNYTPFETSLAVVDREAVEFMLMNILQTERGTYPFEPTFGTNLEQYIFSVNNGTTVSEIENEIHSAITQWLPYVRLSPGGISIEQVAHNIIQIDIRLFLNQQVDVFQFRLVR